MALNYTVETSLNDASWTIAATVQLNNVVLRFIRFHNGPLNVKQFRINVTAALGGYTRIAELSPIYAAASSNSTVDNLLSTSSPSFTTTTPPPPPLSTSSQTKPNTVGIIASVLGGVAGILLAALSYFLWVLKKQRNNNIGIPEAGDGVAVGGTQKSSVGDPLNRKNTVSELGGCYPQEAGGYSRSELL